MAATVHATVRSTLPADDAHPYRSGAWRPNVREWDAPELQVVEGAIPDDARSSLSVAHFTVAPWPR